MTSSTMGYAHAADEYLTFASGAAGGAPAHHQPSAHNDDVIDDVIDGEPEAAAEDDIGDEIHLANMAFVNARRFVLDEDLGT